MALYNDDLEYYRNVFKSVHGFNPRGLDYPATRAEFDRAMAELEAYGDYIYAAEATYQAEIDAAKERAVQVALLVGAPDRATAERWIAQAA